MEIKTLFGLPAHPLIVHVPIVLIPLVAVGAVAMVAVPRWRPRFGWIVVVLAGIALVGVQLAIDSGQALEDHVERSRALHVHAELASSLRPLTLLLFVVVLALMLVDHQHQRGATADAGALRWAVPVVSVLVVIVSLVSTVRLVQIGHNGARASWGEVKMDAAHSREGGEGEGDGG